MRIKIVEGLALGKPIVSTTLGAEGIDVTPGGHMRNVLIASGQVTDRPTKRDHWWGMFNREYPVTIHAEVRDGLSNTFMMFECGGRPETYEDGTATQTVEEGGLFNQLGGDVRHHAALRPRPVLAVSSEPVISGPASAAVRPQKPQRTSSRSSCSSGSSW